ncbi:Acg family FMN-binding oxidoreductase [Saccharomonospora xinjiangensis]|uniref:Nitroreductase family protein n=1 Tax=Saccharomonospora xinjiangensis XJ-54 TaxID=882086 RepID=I0V7L4_9PSEU|nr:nitroreductase family protein [Saccharomonospora xinjiangensis]EID56117.1 nitroreductase family protein [Saccharomonospora xinjiangensis XJ-54]
MTKREWSAADTDVLAKAVVRSPSVHNIQPWRLELPAGEVLLFERADLSLPHHDPHGRDRAISCGAAVANLELAARVLSLRHRVRLLPDGQQGDLVARLTVEGTQRPGEADLRRYSAIARRRSYRRAFSGPALTGDDVAGLVAALEGEEGVRVERLGSAEQLDALAELLEHAATVLKQDTGYQRELAMWTIRDERSHPHGAGVAGSALPPSPLPWSGLVRSQTALPDRRTLAQRLAEETVLLFATEGDGRDAHVRTGRAMQRVWLAAVERGFVAAVQTHPMHLSEARRRFGQRLSLEGHPQVLMRVGRPSGTVPQSPRRREDELLAPRD